jgi:hypothetical protein
MGVGLLGCKGTAAMEKGGIFPYEKNPISPPPSPCHTSPPLPYRELPACPQLGTWREMEKKCQQIHTQGVAQETGTQDKRKDPKLSLEEPGPAWSCSPSQRRGRKRLHRERVSGAFPDTHSQGPPEVQVEEVLHLMSDLKPKAFTNHHMPGGAKFLVHRLFDHLGSTLEGRESMSGGQRGELCSLSGKEKPDTNFLASSAVLSCPSQGNF